MCNLWSLYRIHHRLAFMRQIYNLIATILLMILLTGFHEAHSSNFDPFMDSNLFKINWAGPIDLNAEEELSLGDRYVTIVTKNKEKYHCILPDSLAGDKDSGSGQNGPTADDLMAPLFKQVHCSYRIESYWTYELCHGKHLKQYHETKAQGMAAKVQDFYLGFGNHRNLKTEEKESDTATEVKDSTEESKIPVIDLEGLELPYYEVVMTDGTLCDLTNQPRKTRVMYVCSPDGRGEVYGLKESATCEYEVIVLTAYLCKHPNYKPKTQPVSQIRCHANLGSPMKPVELIKAENEERHLKDMKKEYVGSAQKPEKRIIKAHLKKETQVENKEESIEPVKQQDPVKQTLKIQAKVKENSLGFVTDKQTLRDFLSGSQCFRGGLGWWKHEICFGKSARQYHKDKTQEIYIFLGYFNEKNHLAWLSDNPRKRPTSPPESRRQISHFYSNGDTCDLTGKPRSCEVRLRCVDNMKNPHAVILSLSEPRPCEYLLIVESVLFCPILKHADRNGLFPKDLV